MTEAVKKMIDLALMIQKATGSKQRMYAFRTVLHKVRLYDNWNRVICILRIY